MMEIVISNIRQFKAFFDIVYDTSAESVELQLFPDRMVCAVLDRSRTRYFHITYDDEFFDVYAIDDVESIVIFVEDIYKLLKSCSNKDTLYLELNDPYLVAKIMSENGNSRVFEFVLSSDFVDSPTPPHIDLSTVCRCDVGELKQSVKDIGLIGSDLYTFVANGENLTIMTSDEIPTKYANVIDVDYVSNDGVVTSSFALDYIEQILKFDKISSTVQFKIGESMPLLYTFKDELMGVTVNGLIAPRISEDDE